MGLQIQQIDRTPGDVCQFARTLPEQQNVGIPRHEYSHVEITVGTRRALDPAAKSVDGKQPGHATLQHAYGALYRLLCHRNI